MLDESLWSADDIYATMKSATHFLPNNIYNFALELLPSFLRPNTDHAPKKLHAIAHLDGLRGIACFCVFNFHFLFTYTPKPLYGYGMVKEDDDNWWLHHNWWLHQLPFIRLIYSGRVMVNVFFVISGYVLSIKPLRLMRSRSWDQLFHTLASAVFRRGFRLYMPTFIGTFFVMLAVQMGAFNRSTEVRYDGWTILGINEEHPDIFMTFSEQFWDWFHSMSKLLNPWQWGMYTGIYFNHYDPHLWTIPLEFRSSIVLFLTLLLTSRLRANLRPLSVAGLIIFAINWSRWEVVLFLCGMFLAECDLAVGLWSKPSVLPSPTADRFSTEKPLPQQSQLRTAMWYTLFIIGLYLGSSPDDYAFLTPGYITLSKWIPSAYEEPWRWWPSVGAVIIICCINHTPSLQKIFTSPVAQYLGNISYAFYICHGPILHSLGYSIMPSIWAWTGKDGDAEYAFGFLCGWLVCFPLSVWLGDIFWRWIDIPCVNLAKRLENWCLVEDDKA